MNSAAIELIYPVCGKIWIVNCDELSCKCCRFGNNEDECLQVCECDTIDIIKELQSQVYQLQIENQSLLHERNVWKIFLTEKGEW